MAFDFPSRRDFLARSGAAGAALMSLGAGAFAAAALPDQLRILCSGPAGSIPDIVARRAAEKLGGQLAQHVIVDNRPGAAGQIAVGALKSAAPDGLTMLLAQGAISTVYPYLYPKLAYDPIADLTPVSLASEMTMALAVGPAVPASVTHAREFVDWMRLNPALANVASPGTGTLPHILEAMLFREAGVAWQHIVYSGGPPAILALLGGQVAGLVLPEGLFRQHKATGKLRVLGTSGAQRTALMPDVPTFVEQGFANLVIREWFAFFLPGHVPAATVEASSAALQRVLAQPDLVDAFAESGMVAASSSPLALASRIASEQRFWEPVIRSIGVRAE